ncbi:MAG: branched-chain amino acid ABC transporter permease [Acidimicrobiales bacterium]
MALFVQRIFDACFNGAIYASLALALVTIYRSTGVLNFAQGEMSTFSAYIAYLLFTPGGAGAVAGAGLEAAIPATPWPVPLAIACAVVVGMATGALTERLLIRPLEGRSALAAVNVTIGLLIAINGLDAQLWGSASRRFPSPFPSGPDDFVGVAGARLRFESIGVWLTLLVVLGLLGWIMRATKIGLAFRAVTANRESAALAGIRIGRTLMLGWALAAGLGALSACLVAHTVVLEPSMMIRLLISRSPPPPSVDSTRPWGPSSGA